MTIGALGALGAGGFYLQRCLRRTVVCDGNSLTHGSEEGSYPDQLQSILGLSYRVFNFGICGQTSEHMIQDAATQVDPYASSGSGKPILIAWEITNDLYFDATVKDSVDRFVEYCRGRNGFQVIPMTVLPRSEGGTPENFEAMRQEANARLRAIWPTDLLDVAADPVLGAPGAQLNKEWYADLVHLTLKGYRRIAELVARRIAESAN